MTSPQLPLIDVSNLAAGINDTDAGAAIDRACSEFGFFRIVGHGVSTELFDDLQRLSHEFFAMPLGDKDAISMARGGSAWRGWFPLGGELTSGRPDGKEGLYLGSEHGSDHPRVAAGVPLHGANQFPAGLPLFRTAILSWLDQLTTLAHAVMSGMASGLGLEPDWFESTLTADPTILFRIFHYPPDPTFEWGVAEHTDYGLLTLLAQDDVGGLQVHSHDGWIDVPAEPDVFVCNIGDMLERLTKGRYRSTPHRVKNTSDCNRLSFPFFFDPSWDAEVVPLPVPDPPASTAARRRWDNTDVQAWDGPYGHYLTSRVQKVFPDLFAAIDE